jgi:thioredoxin-related protein
MYVFWAAISIASPAALALEVGDQAACVELDAVLPDGTHEEQCIHSMKSTQSYVLIDFSSTTCYWCDKNLPLVNQLATELDQKMNTREVLIDKNINAVLPAYLTKHKDLLTFAVALDPTRVATKAYGVTATPTMFLVGPDVKIVAKYIGLLSQENMDEIRKIVNTPTP